MTELQSTESYQFIGVCLVIPISSKLHQYCLLVQVAFSASKYRRIYSSTCYRIAEEKLRSATVNFHLRPKPFLMKLNATKCKEPRVCFVKRPSATPFTNLSTSTQNSSFAQGSRQGGRCLPGNRCSGPCGYLRRSFTFRPRVQCCVA